MLGKLFSTCLMCFVCVECLIETSPKIVNHYIAFGDNITLSCSLDLSGCGNKCEDISTIMWNFRKLDDSTPQIIQNSKDFLILNNGSELTITNFTKNFIGKYSCYVSFSLIGGGRFVLRDVDLQLNEIGRPKFILESINTNENGAAVFQCVEEMDNLHSQMHVLWYRDGVLLSPNDTLKMYRSLLVITQSKMSDSGIYRCDVSFGKAQFPVYSSDDVNIKVNKGGEVDLVYKYLSSKQVLWIGETMRLLCVSEMTVVWFKESNQLTHVKLTEDQGLAIYEKKNVEITDSGGYTCIIRNKEDRLEKTIDVTVYDSLIDDNNKVVLVAVSSFENQYEFSCHPRKHVTNASIEWYFNGDLIPELSQNSSMKKLLSNKNMLGVYQCIMKANKVIETKTWLVTNSLQDLKPKNLSLDFSSYFEYQMNWEKPVDSSEDIEYVISIDCVKFSAVVFTTSFKNQCPMCARRLCKYQVCAYEKTASSFHHCTHIYKEMRGQGPLVGPVIKKIHVSQHSLVNIEWNPPDKKYSDDRILDYRVYSFDTMNNREKPQVRSITKKNQATFLLPNSFHIHVIWVIAAGETGESPTSQRYLVSPLKNYVNGPLTIENCNCYFVLGRPSVLDFSSNIPYVSWNVIDSNTHATKLHHFIVYVTSVPYNDYWNATTIVKIPKNQFRYEHTDFQSNLSYRFSVVPVFKKRSIYHKIFEYESTAGIAFHSFFPSKQRFSKMKKTERKEGTFLYLNTFYKSFTCARLDNQTLFFVWQHIPRYRSAKFHVLLIDASTNIMKTYSTDKSYLKLTNMKSSWYFALLKFENIENFKDEYTTFIACPSAVSAPSPVQNISYNFIYVKKWRSTTMQVKFLQPYLNYDSLYFYIIKAEGTGVALIDWIHQVKNHSLIVDNRQTELSKRNVLVSTPFIVQIKSWYKISIFAVNGYGESTPVYLNQTIVTFKPSLNSLFAEEEEETDKDDKVFIKEKTFENNENNDDNRSASNAYNIGVGVGSGIAISSIFLLILTLTICYYKHDKRLSEESIHMQSEPLLGSSSEGDSYLYLQKLQEVQRMSEVSTGVIPHDETSRNSNIKEPTVVCLPFSKIRYSHPLNLLGDRNKGGARELTNPYCKNSRNNVSNTKNSSNQISRNQLSSDLSRSTIQSVDRQDSSQIVNKVGSSSQLKESSVSGGTSMLQSKGSSYSACTT